MRSLRRALFPLVYCCFCTGAILLLCLLSGRAGALDASQGWLAEPLVRLSSGPADGSTSTRRCLVQTVTVSGYGSGDSCISQMNGWRYGDFRLTTTRYGVSTTRIVYVVGLGSDNQLYEVEGMTDGTTVYGGTGDSLVFHDCCGQSRGGPIVLYPDFPKSLTRTATGYRLSSGAVTARYADDTTVMALHIGLSTNGRYVVAETPAGIALITVATGRARLISPLTARRDSGYTPEMHAAVSDDGRTAVIGGRLYGAGQFRIFDTSGDCGATSGVMSDASQCPNRDLEPLFDKGALPPGWPINLQFGDNGRRLDLVVDGFDHHYTGASLFNGGIPTRLRYVALGDSYAAGEGDTERNPLTAGKYYLPLTDIAGGAGVPAEKCHVSSRSYPFRLAEFGALPTGTVQSVACSGARTSDLAYDGAYEGQGGRLSLLSPGDRSRFQTQALDAFIPGRIPQVDFAQHYQPVAMSVTIGGNDLQFSTLVAACIYSPTTCDYAADPSERRALGEAIFRLYPTLTALYGRITAASPGTRLYVVGYPRFVNESKAFCPLTTGLDIAERRLIDYGTRYLNRVIEAAAKTAGVRYVDVEDSLAGHRVCDDLEGYVNAISLFDQERVETYHPNHLGQESIALAIQQTVGADLAANDPCSGHSPCPNPTVPPSVPDYFTDGSASAPFIAIPSELFGGDLIIEGAELVLKAVLLAAGSNVRLEIHSSPQAIGTFTVANDGTLNVPITLPDTISEGFHTVHLYGTSPSGEAVDLYQIVFVTRSPASVAVSTPAPAVTSPTTAPRITAGTCIGTCARPPVAAAFLPTLLPSLLPATTGDAPGPLVKIAGVAVIGIGCLILWLGIRLSRRRGRSGPTRPKISVKWRYGDKTKAS